MQLILHRGCQDEMVTIRRLISNPWVLEDCRILARCILPPFKRNSMQTLGRLFKVAAVRGAVWTAPKSDPRNLHSALVFSDCRWTCILSWPKKQSLSTLLEIFSGRGERCAWTQTHRPWLQSSMNQQLAPECGQLCSGGKSYSMKSPHTALVPDKGPSAQSHSSFYLNSDRHPRSVRKCSPQK